jgi:hypothetical protein
MVKAMKLIFALLSVALIAGEAGTEQRSVAKPRKTELLLSPHSEPAKILMRACGNCHSNHTDWPWYSHVAPVSWWIARHVSEGREKLDFSAWETYSTRQKRDKSESVCGLISTGRMPPRMYSVMHPEARLSEKDKNAVCAWVREQTIAARSK